jgi:phosphoenolpyruvate synthase/pyruvate phosphate dikinase
MTDTKKIDLEDAIKNLLIDITLVQSALQTAEIDYEYAEDEEDYKAMDVAEDDMESARALLEDLETELAKAREAYDTYKASGRAP